MDMEQFSAGDFISAEEVRNSQNRQLVLLSAGSEKEYEGKKKPVFLVEFNGKQKKWVMNKVTVKNLIDTYGKDSNLWVGKTVNLTVGLATNGREMVIGKGIPSIQTTIQKGQ